ncbi:MAG: hypothetical protein U0670_19865 [Anaerolineae bacterium]
MTAKPITAIVGLDESEASAIAEGINTPSIIHLTLPKILVQDGQLWMESDRGPRMVPVEKVIYHAIYEDDLDFISGLALWNGACLPRAHAMMDCRLKLPCLVRALTFTRFGSPARGYASARVRIDTDIERVAKWGNWHCGENKERFNSASPYTTSEPSIIEPYFVGQAVRVVIIGDQAWQIKLDGSSWLKSIHDERAHFMDVDADLFEDTRRVKQGFGLDVIANDYIVGDDGQKHLLEVNHIPNVTRFPEIWAAYRDFCIAWV